MSFIAVGINYKNTPIEIREQLFLNTTQQDVLLSELKSNPAITEACILSTCHRVEIYAYVLDGDMDLDCLVEPICRVKKVPFSLDAVKYFYKYSERDAIRHLFEVAAGLDSLILGEEQILGQVKGAFDKAREAGMFDRRLNILSNFAVRTGKKARSESKINLGGSSISWAAVVKAEEVFGDLGERSILMIGAGTMSELAVGHIQNRKFKKLYLMNRTQKTAEDLAEKHGGEAAAFCDIKEILSRVDICICSAGAPHYLVEKDIVERVMPLRENRKLVFIDISMPRNIDPAIAELKNTLVYQIDDLQAVVDSNMRLREQAIEEVQLMIESKIDAYYNKLKRLPGVEEFSAT